MTSGIVYIIGGITLLTSLLLTYFIRIFALKHKILDIPNFRSSHDTPTPRAGGLAIVVAWYIGITLLFLLKFMDKQIYLALMSGIFLAVVSVIDDLFEIRPLIRLSVQSLTVILAFSILNGIDPVSFSGIKIDSRIFLYAITLIGMIWFINLFNFLDGIDGYASLEAIFIALIMYFYTGNYLLLILIAATAGFLYWNWPKAKIFMGDIGSTQLGFVLVVSGIYFHNEEEISIITWIMLSSLFWFDATLTLFRRWRKKEQLTVAHRKHAYQRAVQSGLSHGKVILISACINLIIFALAFIAAKYERLIIPMFLVDIILLYGITKLIDKKVPFR